MKKVIVFATGGTIACVYDKKTGGLIPALSGHDLIKAIPELENVCKLEIVEVSSEPSARITPERMANLGNLINNALDDNNVAGAVVTHGTDTLEETAFFLSLVIKSDKPVCVTGAMRSSGEICPDGALNIYNACRVAACDNAKDLGVLVVFNEFIFSAQDVIKTHSSSPAAFKSPVWGPLGYADNDKIIIRRKTIRDRVFNPVSFNFSVPIIKIYTDMDLDLLDFIVSKKVDGIIFEAFGRGNLSNKIIPYIKKLVSQNIPVIIATRTFGRVLDVYSYDGGFGDIIKKGVISAGECPPNKARLKLIACLGEKMSINEIKQAFDI